MQALAYARQHLPPFLDDSSPAPEIVSQVMGMFAFARSLRCSAASSSSPRCPYTQQLEQWQLSSLSHELHAAVLANANLPAVSPLHACVRMGNQALPPLLKCLPPPYHTTPLAAVCSDKCVARYATMLKAQDRQVWANASAIPFQLCDDASLLHHSVFVCPVSREKNSLADPPVRLTCGHLLLHSSMMRLGKPPQGRFKCP